MCNLQQHRWRLFLKLKPTSNGGQTSADNKASLLPVLGGCAILSYWSLRQHLPSFSNFAAFG
jgi:hypothetical protein